MVPIWVILGACLAVFYPVLDFRFYAHLLTHQSPGAHATTWVALLGGWAMLLSPSVRWVLYGKPVRWLWRMPISPVYWGVLIAPLTFTAVLPIALVALLRRDGIGGFELASWLGLSLPLLVAVGQRRLRGVVSASVCLMAVAAVAGLGQQEAALAVIAAPLCLGGGTWAAGYLYGDLRGRYGSRTMAIGSLRPRSPLLALIHRDWLCLWRANRGLVLTTAIVTVGLSLIAIVLGSKGADGAVTIWAVLSLSSPLCGQIMSRLVTTQQRQFFPGSWGTTATVRLFSLLVTTAAPLLVIVTVVTAVLGGVGLMGLLLSMTLLLSLVAGQVCMALWAEWRQNASVYMLFGALVLLMITIKYGPVTLVIHLGFVALCGLGSLRLLSRHRESYA